MSNGHDYQRQIGDMTLTTDTNPCTNGHDQRLRDNGDGSQTVYCVRCSWTQEVPK